MLPNKECVYHQCCAYSNAALSLKGKSNELNHDVLAFHAQLWSSVVRRREDVCFPSELTVFTNRWGFSWYWEDAAFFTDTQSPFHVAPLPSICLFSPALSVDVHHTVPCYMEGQKSFPLIVLFTFLLEITGCTITDICSVMGKVVIIYWK